MFAVLIKTKSSSGRPRSYIELIFPLFKFSLFIQSLCLHLKFSQSSYLSSLHKSFIFSLKMIFYRKFGKNLFRNRIFLFKWDKFQYFFECQTDLELNLFWSLSKNWFLLPAGAHFGTVNLGQFQYDTSELESAHLVNFFNQKN